MKCIKQKPGSKNCVACVAAMVTNTSIEEFVEHCKIVHDNAYEPYSFYELVTYLASKNFTIPIGINNFQLNEDSIEEAAKSFRLNLPAILVVKSMTLHNAYHCVYWDGERVLDPNPLIQKDGLQLKDYKIESWVPVRPMNNFQKQQKAALSPLCNFF